MKLRLGAVLLFGVLATASSASNQWYKDCKSQKMLDNYISGFKHLIHTTVGTNIKIVYSKLNSEPEKLTSNANSKCKVNIAYRILSGYDYNEGTIDIVSIAKKNTSTGNIDFDFESMNEKSRQGNVLNDALGKSLK